MSKKFVRKIIGVKTIQNLRDYTNEVGDIILKDGIHGYLRTEDEYKPITYPIIWDYGTGKGHESRSDMHVNAKGIHKLDTKNKTSASYDLENEHIVSQVKIDRDNDNDDRYTELTSDISKGTVMNDAYVGKTQVHENIDTTSYNLQYVTEDATFDANTKRFKINISASEQIETDVYTKNNNIKMYSDVFHLNIQTNPSDINAGNAASFAINLDSSPNQRLSSNYGSTYNEITQSDNNFELTHNIESYIKIKSGDNSNALILGSESDSRNGLIMFIANGKELDFYVIYNESNNDYKFGIAGDPVLTNAFRDAIDALLGFTTTINGLKQRISSLESRVTSLENR